jgi:NRAMP (natural resistance-associated macrophage protein)-like metal ion transporter
MAPKQPPETITSIEQAEIIIDKDRVSISEKRITSVSYKSVARKAKTYWRTLGPGLTTGAADDDPSGIATYSQTGAQYGSQLLWLAIFTTPLMVVAQEMCGRLGIVTGHGLAANIRTHYSKWVLYTCAALLFLANTFNIGADIGAMAKAIQLLAPGFSFVILVVAFSLLSLLLQIFTSYAKYARYLKYLSLVLFSYVVTGFIVHLNWTDILRHSFLPVVTFSKDQLFLICAILGTTISPYLFFWQTSQEVEEEILKGKKTIEKPRNITKKDISDMRVDTWSGMFVSNLIMFFIIAVCAATLFTHGVTNIATAADAAAALKPLAGQWAYLLFAIGIIGTGLLAIPVLAGSTSYALAESFKQKEGLYRKFKDAGFFYGILIVSMAIGLFLNFINLDPIKALIYSAVANGVIAPVILVLIVRMSSNKNLMGEWASRPSTTVFGWILVGIMGIAGIAAIGSLFL